MSDKQNLGPGSTKDRLDATLEWNAVIERQCGKKTAPEEPDERAGADGDREHPKGQGDGGASEVLDLDHDAAGDRGC